MVDISDKEICLITSDFAKGKMMLETSNRGTRQIKAKY